MSRGCEGDDICHLERRWSRLGNARISNITRAWPSQLSGQFRYAPKRYLSRCGWADRLKSPLKLIRQDMAVSHKSNSLEFVSLHVNKMGSYAWPSSSTRPALELCCAVVSPEFAQKDSGRSSSDDRSLRQCQLARQPWKALCSVPDQPLRHSLPFWIVPYVLVVGCEKQDPCPT